MGQSIHLRKVRKNKGFLLRELNPKIKKKKLNPEFLMGPWKPVRSLYFLRPENKVVEGLAICPTKEVAEGSVWGHEKISQTPTDERVFLSFFSPASPSRSAPASFLCSLRLPSANQIRLELLHPDRALVPVPPVSRSGVRPRPACIHIGARPRPAYIQISEEDDGW
jgi:hypothetical protein